MPGHRILVSAERSIERCVPGGVVVFPTETAYGLAADVMNPRAVHKVMLIKGRDRKTMPLIASSFAMATRNVYLSPMTRELAKKYWPGPLTIVAPAKAKKRKHPVSLTKIHPDVVREDGTAAIRVTSHPIAAALARRLGNPIVATSANLAGKPACYTLSEFQKQMKGRRYQPDYLIDAGRLKKRPTSTIIKEDDGVIVILRQGEIKIPKTYVA